MPRIQPISAPKSILITGASSGIGDALARAYAEPGVSLALCARNGERLEAVAERCRESGASVDAEVLNVTDRERMAAWIARRDAANPLDLVVANAGISGGGGGGGGGEADDQARAIFDINVTGMLNTITPASNAMRARRRGQIAVVSSVAGFRGLPTAPAYSASKAAVLAYGDALRVTLAADGLAVSVICPGFVESRMTETNRFHMPFLMNADRAAAIIKRRLAKGQGRIVFPLPMHAGARLLQLLPTALADAILSRAPAKD